MQLADPHRRFSLVLLDHFQAANGGEELPTAALLKQLAIFYPSLKVEAVAGDSASGVDLVLSTIYRLGAKRVVALRSHETDRDKAAWPL